MCCHMRVDPCYPSIECLLMMQYVLFIATADIVFILKHKPHPTLLRDGDNLIFRPEISLLEVGVHTVLMYILSTLSSASI